jgi:hypothetical protein
VGDVQRAADGGARLRVEDGVQPARVLLRGARIGRDWYVKAFDDDVKRAADYGSACWSKVVSGWEAWKNEGLTAHRNRWPDLYREACRVRGVEPDAKTLAFAKTYAQTRADLERIAVSG